MTDNEMALMLASVAVDMQDKDVNDVLDKIRTEIEDFEEEVFHRTKDYSDYAAVRYCLEIIDKHIEKHKAESEES